MIDFDMYEDKKTKKDKMYLKTRMLHLFDEIERDTIQEVIKGLLELDRDKKKRPITLYICSPGGSVEAGFALIDVLEKCKCTVKTVALGEICSMAPAIFVVGKKGHRYIGKRAQVMFHPVTTGYHDYIKFAESRIKNGRKVEEMYDRLILEKTKIPKEVYQEAKDKELWLGSQEAIKYGIADHIL